MVVRPDWRARLERERRPDYRGWSRLRVQQSWRALRQAGRSSRRGTRAFLDRDWRTFARELGPRLRTWLGEHRVLTAGVVVVALCAAADATAVQPVDIALSPGMAQRVPVAYPLQAQADLESGKRYLDAIDNGERIRESEVVAAAAQDTLQRAQAEAAAAVAGEPQPWLTGPMPPGTAGVGPYVLPAVGTFTSGYGPRWGGFHYGIDIAAPIGSPIYAVTNGTVINAGPAEGFGLWVRVQDDDGTISVYGHMYDFSVSAGERVHAGEQIARVGNRGDATGPHLHFEILVAGQHVDPQPWLAAHGIKVG